MASAPPDIVKQQVAAHWERRAAHFDEDFGHSIKTPAERAAWGRVFALIVPPRGPLDALDVGCGTGFMSFELARRGHRVSGVDLASAMLAEARRKAARLRLPAGFAKADAEALPFAARFDLVVCRHLLWTLPHPQQAIAEWVRVLRPGGRLAVIDGQFDPAALPDPAHNARRSPEYAAIGDGLPFLGGRPQAEIEALLRAHGLRAVRGDPLSDLVAAQARHMAELGQMPRPRRRYVVWGDVAG